MLLVQGAGMALAHAGSDGSWDWSRFLGGAAALLFLFVTTMPLAGRTGGWVPSQIAGKGSEEGRRLGYKEEEPRDIEGEVRCCSSQEKDVVQSKGVREGGTGQAAGALAPRAATSGKTSMEVAATGGMEVAATGAAQGPMALLGVAGAKPRHCGGKALAGERDAEVGAYDLGACQCSAGLPYECSPLLPPLLQGSDPKSRQETGGQHEGPDCCGRGSGLEGCSQGSQGVSGSAGGCSTGSSRKDCAVPSCLLVVVLGILLTLAGHPEVVHALEVSCRVHTTARCRRQSEHKPLLS